MGERYVVQAKFQAERFASQAESRHLLGTKSHLFAEILQKKKYRGQSQSPKVSFTFTTKAEHLNIVGPPIHVLLQKLYMDLFGTNYWLIIKSGRAIALLQ